MSDTDAPANLAVYRSNVTFHGLTAGRTYEIDPSLWAAFVDIGWLTPVADESMTPEELADVVRQHAFSAPDSAEPPPEMVAEPQMVDAPDPTDPFAADVPLGDPPKPEAAATTDASEPKPEAVPADDAATDTAGTAPTTE